MKKTATELFGKRALKRATVDVPGIGTVHLREPSGAVALALEAIPDRATRARLLLRAAVMEPSSDEPLFAAEEDPCDFFPTETLGEVLVVVSSLMSGKPVSELLEQAKAAAAAEVDVVEEAPPVGNASGSPAAT